MASTALSCVLWWRWLGILVMFHGMDRHRGIRTDSQDAARTAGGHSAQDTASRDTESPRESMSVRSERGHWSHGSTVSTPLKCRSFTESLIQIRTRFFPADLCFSAAAAAVRSADSSRKREEGAAFLFRLSPPPLPLSVFLYNSPSLLPSHLISSSSCSSPLSFILLPSLFPPPSPPFDPPC